MATAKKATKSKSTTKSTSTAKTTKSTTDSDKKCSAGKPFLIGVIVVVVIAIATFVTLGLLGLFGTNISGTYDLVSMEENGEDQSSMISFMKALGMKGELVLRDDKTGTMNLFNEDGNEITYDGKKIKNKETGDEVEYTYKDNKITLTTDGTKMVFEKKTDK